MALIIVESPTKAKTITSFLGKKHKVLSSFGHVRDLPKKELGVDVEKNFELTYSIPQTAHKALKPIKEAMKKEKEVIFASDEDREGEAISWHLAQILKIDPEVTKRIVFHEITPEAIEKAMKTPRGIKMTLVDAQQARRVLDRLVGYKLSPFLWKKIHYGLSAGRVQSVAVRFIVEREREVEKFKKRSYYTIQGSFSPDSEKFFEAQLIAINKTKIFDSKTYDLFDGQYKSTFTSLQDIKEVKEALKEIKKEKKYTVSKLDAREKKRRASPPFITSTIQREASWRLGFSSKQTMRLAQQLYEGIKLNGKQTGLITYMRTDSFNLAGSAITSIRKTIESEYGKDYLPSEPTVFKKKAKGAQEAHEAIRPVSIDQTPEKLAEFLDGKQLKLYTLIWQRTMACQMTPQILDSSTVLLDSKSEKYQFKATGVRIKFDGWTKVYPQETKENNLPNMKENDILEIGKAEEKEHETSPPPRYGEGALIKALEEYGIGRPSTYASIISTIQDRTYVEKNEQNKFTPTEKGILVNDMLVKHFKDIVDTDFTAGMEEKLDDIANGTKEWKDVIGKFYFPFEKNLQKKDKEVDKVQEELDKKCPECGNGLVAKHGRFGKFIACSNYPDCKHTEKTEEEKKEAEEFKDEKCDKCSAPMVVKKGRFGAFLGCSKYPDCKGIRKIEKKTGVKCDKCGEGELVEKMSKRGKFYGCNKYPDCKNAKWKLETEESA